LVTIWLLVVLQVEAKVTPGSLFGDNGVLQEGGVVPVWGTAREAEVVTVEFQGQKKSTTTRNGRWLVKLKKLQAGGPFDLEISGDNFLRFTNILVGDVWLCSGQSNMEVGMAAVHNTKEELSKGNHPSLRLFVVTLNTAFDPQTAVLQNPANDLNGYWQICTPETLAQDGTWSAYPGFSGVGYFFGREIQAMTGKPVGLIGSYYGGTLVEAWTSLDALKRRGFTNQVLAYQTALARSPQERAEFPIAQVKYERELALWKAQVETPYNAALQAWKAASDQARADKKALPSKPLLPQPAPVSLPTGDAGKNTPGVLFNAMIQPLIPYAMKGVIWYQGEQNAAAPDGYAELFQCMVTDWRQRWGLGKFPFLFVQIAGYYAPQSKPSEGGWARLREEQFKSLSVPNTGMASAMDLGAPFDVHPRDKYDVGRRLALAAKKIAYGQSLTFCGPLYESMRIEGDKIHISFRQVGGGLKMGTPPWTPSGKTLPVPAKLTGFAISGADRNWFWGDAVIEGDNVVVSSAEVKRPIAVRYGWASFPVCNLYNVEGLPASSFRTDDWRDN